jgi:hypothetical protein
MPKPHFCTWCYFAYLWEGEDFRLRRLGASNWCEKVDCMVESTLSSKPGRSEHRAGHIC